MEPQILVIDPHVVTAIICICIAALGVLILWCLSQEEKKHRK